MEAVVLPVLRGLGPLPVLLPPVLDGLNRGEGRLLPALQAGFRCGLGLGTLLTPRPDRLLLGTVARVPEQGRSKEGSQVRRSTGPCGGQALPFFNGGPEVDHLVLR